MIPFLFAGGGAASTDTFRQFCPELISQKRLFCPDFVPSPVISPKESVPFLFGTSVTGLGSARYATKMSERDKLGPKSVKTDRNGSGGKTHAYSYVTRR